MKSSFAIAALALLFCGGISLAQAQAPAGLTEGMDPAIARRVAVAPPSNEQLVIPPATNEWLNDKLAALESGATNPFDVADELLARSAELLTRTDR